MLNHKLCKLVGALTLVACSDAGTRPVLVESGGGDADFGYGDDTGGGDADAGYGDDTTVEDSRNQGGGGEGECVVPEQVPEKNSYAGPCRIEEWSVMSSELGRIHTYSYGPDERLVRYERDGNLASDSVPDGQPDEVVSYSYNGANLLMKRREETVGEGESLWTLYYNDVELLIEEKETQLQSAGTFEGVRLVYSYDKCGRESRLDVFPPGSTEASLAQLSYYVGGRLDRVETFVYGGPPESTMEPERVVRYSYNDKNQLLEEEIVSRSASTVQYIRYQYDDLDLLERVSRYSDSTLEVFTTYEYDSEHNLVTADTFSPAGATVSAAYSYECW